MQEVNDYNDSQKNPAFQKKYGLPPEFWHSL